MNKTFKMTGIGLICGATVLAAAFMQPRISDWAQTVRTGPKSGAFELTVPSYVNHGDLVENTVVHPGDLFFVRHRFKKTFDCAVTKTNFLTGDKTINVISFEKTATTWMRPGDYDVNEGYTMPPNIPPGDYHFSSKVISRCGGQDYYTMGFNVPVTVVP